MRIKASHLRTSINFLHSLSACQMYKFSDFRQSDHTPIYYHVEWQIVFSLHIVSGVECISSG